MCFPADSGLSFVAGQACAPQLEEYLGECEDMKSQHHAAVRHSSYVLEADELTIFLHASFSQKYT
jgi:hypothetical protein